MHFPQSYPEARTAFCQAARQCGARLHRYTQPGVLGLMGEDLSIDVAEFGMPDAQAAAIVITGVHGAEAPCGSAVLNAWLLGRRAPLAPDTRLVLLHAANPWGYSHQTRTTENNVDLNRNFRQSWDRIENPSYALLRPFYHAITKDAAESWHLYSDYRSCLDQNGWHHEANMTRGQTDHADGLYLAGRQPEWANLCIRQIFRDHLHRARKIGFLDIHTGMGDFGQVIFLTFADPPDDHRQALSWWQVAAGANPLRPVPDYEGLLCRALQQEVPAARAIGAVMEFGVADAYAMFRSDRLDRWLRFEGRNDPDRDALLSDYRASCCPEDLSWRRLVQRAGPAAIDRLISGVADWAAERP